MRTLFNQLFPMFIFFLGITLFPISLQAQEWELVWADEFNEEGLPDSTKWQYEYGPPYKNNEKQFYAREELKYSRIEDGCLILEAHREEREGADYVSASLHTQGKKDFLYGRVEARLKMPKGRGTWPAFWMLGTNIDEVGWPTCGELDIMEYVGFDPEKVHANIHTEAYNHQIGTNKGDSIHVNKPYEEFHVYAIEWFEDRVDFFVDDIKYFTFEKPSDDMEEWPFDKPHYLIINLAIGGNLGGQQGIDDSLFPHKYYIDYVRYYKQK